MNWLDYILIIIWSIALVAGLRIGVIGAIYWTIIVFLGWLVSAQLGALVGPFFKLFFDDDQIITLISFTVIMVLIIYLGQALRPSIRSALGIGTLGASNVVDRVGGLVVGLVLGITLSGALLMGVIHLTYTFDTTADIRESLETALVGSTFVAIFVREAHALPGESLGFIPGDFQTSLEILKDSID